MEEYAYLRNMYNPNYIEKVTKQQYQQNYARYASNWIPLSAEETKAEDLYRQKVEPNEWKYAGKSFAGGLTASLTELGLSSEEKELLGKYKQRSTVGQTLGFLGSVAGVLLPAGAGARLAAYGVRGAVAAGRAAQLGRGAAILGGEAAGVTAYTATKRMVDRVGMGKPVSDTNALELVGSEFVKNFALGGAITGAFKGVKYALTGAKNTGQALAQKLLGAEAKGTAELDRNFLLKLFGFEEKKAADKLIGLTRATGSVDRRAGAGIAVEEEAKKVVQQTLKNVKGREPQLPDLENTLRTRLNKVGKDLSALRSTVDEKIGYNVPSTIKNKVVSMAESLKEILKKTTPSASKVKKINEAFNKNMFKKVTKMVNNVKRSVTIVDKNFFENLRKTKSVVNSYMQKATDAESKGLFKKIFKDLSNLEKEALEIYSKRAGGRFSQLKNQYAILSTLDESLQARILKMRESGLGPSALRDISRLGLLSGGALTGGVVGGIATGTTGFIAGSMAGAALGSVAAARYARPWRMSIYPDIYTKANRLISGGRMMPDVFIKNVERSVERRHTLLDKLSQGIKDIPTSAYRGNFVKSLNDLTSEEELETLESLRNTLTGALSDPQQLNNVAMGAAELISQAGGSDYAPQVQSDVMEMIQKLVSVFPEDRLVPRADDLNQTKNLWSKRDIKTIKNRLEVFFDPDDLIEDWISGRRSINLDQVQFLNLFYPQHFQALKQYLLIGMNGPGMKLSRKEKNKFSYLFGIPINTAFHPSLLSITEQTSGLASARQAQQREQIRKNLNLERKADSLKTGAERSMLQEERT